MPRPGVRKIAAAGLVLAAAIALLARPSSGGQPDSDYFGPNAPTWVRVPTTLGDPVYVGVTVLSAGPGDAIRLESLDVERREGDVTIETLVRILHGGTRTLGGIAASQLPHEFDLSTYAAVPGFRFSEADGPVELSLRIAGTTPIHGFDGLWLRFTRNGESAVVADWIPMRASVCTGSTQDQAVERCRPIEDQMRSFGL